jgi:hypothetical protein
LENREYKYSDSRADALDSTYTKWVNHPSALRHYWSNRSLNNNTSISWKSKWVEKISTGLKYSLIEINDSESKTNLHYAALYGEVQAQLGSFISFQSRASVELLEEAGDFDLSGDLAVQWGDIGQLSGHLSLGLQSPEYYQLNLVFNGEKLWDVALSKTEYLQLGGNLSVDALNIDIEANQFVLNDWIYFNSDLDWTISDDVLTLSQIGITSDITFGSFYLKNGLLWQSTDAALVTVPEWFTRHIIYYQNRVFKRNMLLSVGLEGNIIIQDNDPTFIPIINHFSPGSNLQNDLSYRVDPFLHAKVKSLELVLKAENIESLWTDIPFVYAEGYPYNDWIFRLQINWRMMK